MVGAYLQQSCQRRRGARRRCTAAAASRGAPRPAAARWLGCPGHRPACPSPCRHEQSEDAADTGTSAGASSFGKRCKHAEAATSLQPCHPTQAWPSAACLCWSQAPSPSRLRHSAVQVGVQQVINHAAAARQAAHLESRMRWPAGSTCRAAARIFSLTSRGLSITRLPKPASHAASQCNECSSTNQPAPVPSTSL